MRIKMITNWGAKADFTPWLAEGETYEVGKDGLSHKEAVELIEYGRAEYTGPAIELFEDRETATVETPEKRRATRRPRKKAGE